MIRNTTRNQKLGWVLFIAYLALLVYFLIFSESLGRDASQRDYAYNLELFKEIRRFYVYVIAFMPCGFFLPIVSRRSRKWYNTVLLGFLLSLSVETLQLVLRVGSFDVDDLLLNTLGGGLGYLVNRMIQKVRIRRKKVAKG